MKIIKLCSVLFTLALSSFLASGYVDAAASILQEKSQARSGAATTRASTAFTNNCVTGSTIEAWVTFNGTVAPATVIDGALQVYTFKDSVYNPTNDYTLALYIFQNNASVTKLVVTATWAVAGTGEGVWTREVGGVASSSFQVSKNAFQSVATTSADAITTGNITSITTAPALISAMQEEGFASVNSVAGTGFTSGTTGFGTWGVSESKRITVTTAVPATFTNTTDGGTAGLGFNTLAAVYTEATTASPSQMMLLFR